MTINASRPPSRPGRLAGPAATHPASAGHRRHDAGTPDRPPDPALPAVRPLAPSARDHESRDPAAGGGRPSAPLLAQLIATRMGLPQTRQLRRAEPADAGASYARAAALDAAAVSGRPRSV